MNYFQPYQPYAHCPPCSLPWEIFQAGEAARTT
eukprot:COSAG05_NODE_21381_length_272_cov_0.641618_1_plen_32_part_10